MPKTAALCMVGAASISAFPLFSGFVSKSMVMSAALHEHHDIVWLFLLFASAGVFHHAGIKIPFFAFYAHDSGIRVKEAPTSMLIAMSIAAFFCIFNGTLPNVFLYPNLPFPVEYVPYTSAHVIAQVQVLFFSALAFMWLKLSGRYPPELKSVNLDADWLYRRVASRAALGVARAGWAIRSAVVEVVGAGVGSAIGTARRHMGHTGVMARTWPTGTSVIWVAILLGLFLPAVLRPLDVPSRHASAHSGRPPRRRGRPGGSIFFLRAGRGAGARPIALRETS